MSTTPGTTRPPLSPAAEYIKALREVHARDRELLAMAREKLEYIRSEARASDNTFDWAAPNHLRAVLRLATEALAALGTEA